MGKGKSRPYASQIARPARHASLKLPMALRPHVPAPASSTGVEDKGTASFAKTSIQYPSDVRRRLRKYRERMRKRRLF